MAKDKKKKEAIPPPLLLSAIICEQVIINALNRLPSIINAFENLKARKYPARYPRLAFFWQLTNGRGKAKITINLVDIEKEDEPIFQRVISAQFGDVRQVANLMFDISGIVFPHPGEYRFQIFVGTALLGERRIICEEIEVSSGDKNE